MSELHEIVSRGRRVDGHAPWRRAVVGEAAWRLLADKLAAGDAALLGLWGEPDAVHAALLEGDSVAVASLDCPAGAFPSLAARHAPALGLERAVADLFGLEPRGLPDTRHWLDHGRWGMRAPLGRAPAAAPPSAAPTYAFLPAEGEGLHEVPVGPVHASVIEPGHFRFTVNGETVVRLETRLGYVHKGIEGLMAGAALERAAMLAGRTCGDSTVAYAWAFARAAEAALGVDVPARADWLRALLAELERLANHLGDIGAVCNDASFALMHAHCGVLRERVLRAADACFGHRLMRDRIVPGGVAADLDDGGRRAIAELVAEIRRRFPTLIDLYENTASLQDRTVGAGTLKVELARQFAAGGYVGRASGRQFDARKNLAYGPYPELEFEVPVLTAGDVDARVWIRIREVEQSVALVTQILERMPPGETRVGLPAASGGGEGVALVEGFRGDVLAFVRLGGDGAVRRCHLRDPSWFQWPLVEAAAEGNIIADFPLCNKSFNCAYSGHDL